MIKTSEEIRYLRNVPQNYIGQHYTERNSFQIQNKNVTLTTLIQHSFGSLREIR
jgi:hypothetical protein